MTEESLQVLTQRLNEMEKRLKVSEDIEQIKQLHMRYQNAHTFHNAQDELDCWAEDCTFVGGDGEEIPIKGKEAIAKTIKQTESPWKESAEPIPDGAFVVHPLITVDGDKANGNWLMYDMHSHPRTYQSLFWIQGIYNCEYVRENGEWKISYLRWRPRIHPPGRPPWDTPLGAIPANPQK